jgi:hypothetical protein
MSNKNHGWTKESWMAYKEAYRAWSEMVFHWFLTGRAINEMMDRED